MATSPTPNRCASCACTLTAEAVASRKQVGAITLYWCTRCHQNQAAPDLPTRAVGDHHRPKI